jgi:hypothetical protein
VLNGQKYEDWLKSRGGENRENGSPSKPPSPERFKAYPGNRRSVIGRSSGKGSYGVPVFPLLTLAHLG